MSNDKKSSTRKSESKAAKGGKLKPIASGIARALASLKTKTGIIVLLMLAGAFAFDTFFGTALTGSTAMLYIFANNGKLSGRADGNVYQRNGRVRGYFNPSLVQNVYTTTIRALLSNLSSSWNTLTEENRDTWNAMEWLNGTNRFGQPISIRGKDAYVTLNSNLALTSNTLIIDAPIDSGGVDGVTSLSLVPDQSAGTLILTFAPTPTDAGVDHIVMATRPLSAGTNKPRKSDFRMIGTIAPATATGLDIATEYTAKYGDAWDTNAGYLGGKIFIKLKPVNSVTGAEGANIVAAGVIQV